MDDQISEPTLESMACVYDDTHVQTWGWSFVWRSSLATALDPNENLRVFFKDSDSD
jgi:hypothetical protein